MTCVTLVKRAILLNPFRVRIPGAFSTGGGSLRIATPGQDI